MVVEVSQAELLRRLQDEYDRFTDLLERIPVETYSEPGVLGRWSVHDLLAHLIAHEQRALAELAAAQRGEVLIIDHAANDSFNAGAVFACRPLGSVALRQAWATSFHQVIQTVAQLPESVFRSDSPMVEALGDSIDGALGNNTYGHYAEHYGDLARWIEVHDWSRA